MPEELVGWIDGGIGSTYLSERGKEKSGEKNFRSYNCSINKGLAII